MKILGIIPSRYASSRFPGKPLINLKGKSMIRRVYEGASKSARLTDLIVATDDRRIFDEVVSFGGKAIMTHESHSTGTDRCAEVLKNWEGHVDVVINIQGDEPLVNAHQLDLLLDAFLDENTQIATIASPKILEEDLVNPNRIKVVKNTAGNAMYFSRSAIPNYANSKVSPLESYPYLRHIGLYAYRANVLESISHLEPCALEQTESLEQLRWMYHGYPVKLVETDIETPNIDTPEDVQKVLDLL